MKTVDYVFPYVNSNDSTWKQQYNKYVGKLNDCRYRDSDMLKYKIEGLRRFAPWARPVMLVSSQSQVPSWVDTNYVRIVTHSQFIPSEYLPTFNSCTIEMFLHDIPGLSDIFIYSNDDVYITAPCELSDFIGEKPKVFLNVIKYRNNTIFERTMLGQWKFLCKIHDKPIVAPEFRPQHWDTVMIRNFNKEFYVKHKGEINKHISRTRRIDNFNQYLYVIAAHLSGKYQQATINAAYYSMDKLNDKVDLSPYKLVCLNDNIKVTENNIATAKRLLNKLYYKSAVVQSETVSVKNVPQSSHVDFVFPYVTMSDPHWQELYNKYHIKTESAELSGKQRFADNGLLKFMFRSIAKNMPWIDKMHMLVMSDSQVPLWVNRGTVNIITHDKFMPSSVLPTFNSSAIEMYLGALDDVSDYFVYGNDDLYALAPLKISDFIRDGKLVKTMHKRTYKYFWDALRLKDYNLIFNTPENKSVVYADAHTFTAYNKNTIKDCVMHHFNAISESITRFRDNEKNYNKWIFDLYDIQHGNTITDDAMLKGSKSTVIKNINKYDLSQYKAICINDDETNDYTSINEFLLKLFPDKCKYEL